MAGRNDTIKNRESTTLILKYFWKANLTRQFTTFIDDIAVDARRA